MFEAMVHSIFGDKNKGWQKELKCPYMLCPSNQPYVGAYSPKMKFIQKLGPCVYQYRCKDCGSLVNVSVEVAETGEEHWRINPAFVSGNPSFEWRPRGRFN